MSRKLYTVRQAVARKRRLVLAITLCLALAVCSFTGAVLIQLQTDRKNTGFSQTVSNLISDTDEKLHGTLQPSPDVINSLVRPENISEENFENLKNLALNPSESQNLAYYLLLRATDLNDQGLSSFDNDIIEFFNKEPDRFPFVYNFPNQGDPNLQTRAEVLTEDLSSMPHLLQWDLRWGYQPYGQNLIYAAACGPTTVSMVASFLKQDATLTPPALCDLAQETGDYVPDQGTASSFFTNAAAHYGLDAEALTPDAATLTEALDAGKPVIMHMVPGDFTTIGHFIIAVGLENGQLRVLDPNSIVRTEKLWDLDTVISQCSEMWAFSNPDPAFVELNLELDPYVQNSQSETEGSSEVSSAIGAGDSLKGMQHRP